MSANIFGQTSNFGQTFGHFLILFILLEMLSLVQETLITRDRYTFQQNNANQEEHCTPQKMLFQSGFDFRILPMTINK